MKNRLCRWLGVDHILLTENDSSKPILNDIQEFVDSGFVTYRVDNKPFNQMEAYLWCYEKYRHKFNWLAFFDADEFLVLREK